MTERKAWVYTRIKEASAEQMVLQMYDLLRYATEHGFDLAGNSQEVTQEQSIHRPALAAIMRALRSEDADTLLVQSLSCVTEDPEQLFEFLCALDVLNVEQVSEILGICTKTVYKLLGQGQITSIRVGRTYRVPKAHLLTYLLNPGNVQNN